MQCQPAEAEMVTQLEKDVSRQQAASLLSEPSRKDCFSSLSTILPHIKAKQTKVAAQAEKTAYKQAKQPSSRVNTYREINCGICDCFMGLRCEESQVLAEYSSSERLMERNGGGQGKDGAAKRSRD